MYVIKNALVCTMADAGVVKADILVENGKIAEHWDVMETIADQSTWQNQNGKF